MVNNPNFLGVLWIIVVFTGLLTPFSSIAESDSLSRADRILAQVKVHLQNYPLANYEDAYKFIHQAALGPGHLGVTWEIIDRYLIQEWESMQDDSVISSSAGESDPIVEDLGGAFVRVNLLRYQEAGGRLDDLRSVLRKSVEVAPDSLLLHEVWVDLSEWLIVETGIDPDSLASFTNMLSANNWPAVHHSTSYKDSYRPHYRVLERSIAVQLLDSLPLDSTDRENGMGKSSATSRRSSNE